MSTHEPVPKKGDLIQIGPGGVNNLAAAMEEQIYVVLQVAVPLSEYTIPYGFVLRNILTNEVRRCSMLRDGFTVLENTGGDSDGP